MSGGAAGSALYLDTSCLLNLFLLEVESAHVVSELAREDRVIVSELGRLEAETQLRARLVGGSLTKAKHRRLSAELAKTLSLEPFVVVAFPMDAFEGARRLAEKVKVHCRTLDLLHLAAMAALGIERLFTTDRAQSTVARALGLAVTMPGVARK